MFNSQLKRDLIQYGFTPRRLLFRMSGKLAPRIVANSIPKAGTNLLSRALYLMYPLSRKFARTLLSNESLGAIDRKLSHMRSGQFVVGHLEYSDAIAEIIMRYKLQQILMVRDPRDIVVSHVNYVIRAGGGHPLHKYYTKRLNHQERLMTSILGVDGMKTGGFTLPSIVERIRKFVMWSSSENCFAVKFEELVGEEGGGDSECQMHILLNMAEYLQLDLSRIEIDDIRCNLFSKNSRTFEKGQIGSWKDHFKEQHVQAFYDLGGGILLDDMGYSSE